MSNEKAAGSISGRVVSAKMDKTVTVLVERRVKHLLYKKYISKSTKLHAHDAENQCNEGDLVTIAQCRPLSKTKAFAVVSVDERAV